MAFAHQPDREPQETPLEDLIEARERIDAGMRVAFPSPSPAQAIPSSLEIPAEVVDRMIPHLAELRESAIKAALPLPPEGYEDIHSRLNELVNEAVRIGAVLMERRGDGS